jgi:hypothetical protein
MYAQQQLSWHLEAYLNDFQSALPGAYTSEIDLRASRVSTSSPSVAVKQQPLLDALETCQRMHDKCLKILMQWHPAASSPDRPHAGTDRRAEDFANGTSSASSHSKIHEWIGAAIGRS